jgi:hypothetical protein
MSLDFRLTASITRPQPKVAHGSIFDLLQFDGQKLTIAATQASTSPGSRLEDLNDDGLPEVLLDQTD